MSYPLFRRGIGGGFFLFFILSCGDGERASFLRQAEAQLPVPAQAPVQAARVHGAAIAAVPEMNTIKVIDRYPEGDDVRVNKKVPEGTPYTYKSKNSF